MRGTKRLPKETKLKKSKEGLKIPLPKPAWSDRDSTKVGKAMLLALENMQASGKVGAEGALTFMMTSPAYRKKVNEIYLRQYAKPKKKR